MSYGTQVSLEDEESGSLLERTTGSSSSSAKRHAWNRRIVSLVSLFLVAVTIAFVAITDKGATSGGSAVLDLAEADIGDGFQITNTGEYDSSLDIDLLPWDLVVEPYREHILSVPSEYDRSKEFTWRVGENVFQGPSIQVLMKHAGKVHQCSVTEVDKEGNSITRNFTLAVKYVRRDITTLKKADYEAFNNAMKIVYDYENAEVYKQKYGDGYKSILYFAKKHLNAAGTSDCDHYHDGSGFGTNHIALTLEFEKSLQSIDPKLSMPYWEYGRDAVLMQADWASSPIVTALGGISASSHDGSHKIEGSSEWAGLEVPVSTQTTWNIQEEGILNPLTNAYGQLRAPWNENPSAKVARASTTYGFSEFTNLPSCESFSTYYQSNKIAMIMSALNGILHGPVHVMIGGAWDDAANFEEDKDLHLLQTLDRVLFFKVMWRKGLTRCPETCDGTQRCVCSIPEEYWETIGAEKMVEMAQMLDPESHVREVLLNADDKKRRAFLQMCASPGIVGDMLTSNAAYDPFFWPLHGQLERLIGLKRINKFMNMNDFDEKWEYINDATTLKGVCDWSNVKSTKDLTLPSCDATAQCYGHGPDDLMDFYFLEKGKRLVFTNLEFYEWVNPLNDYLTYVYDTYKFSYCTAENGGVVGPEVGYSQRESMKKNGRIANVPTEKGKISSAADLTAVTGREGQKVRRNKNIEEERHL